MQKRLRNQQNKTAYVLRRQPSVRRLATIVAVLIACAALTWQACQASAEESNATKEAYKNYIARLDSQMEARNLAGKGFLWLDADSQRHSAVLKGESPIARLDSPDIPGATLEHWIGGEFIPGVTLDKVIRADQDYASYPRFYGPEILDVKVIAHDGNHFKAYYRIKKHKVVTVVLDTIHDVDFVPLTNNRYYIRSHAEQIHEVRNYGEADQKVLPEGQGIGFLWGMDSYWRMEQRDGGVYMECEVVTLGRSVPFGMGALVHSVIESLASDSLKSTLLNKRRAVMASH
jgi:hypothetical protein